MCTGLAKHAPSMSPPGPGHLQEHDTHWRKSELTARQRWDRGFLQQTLLTQGLQRETQGLQRE